MRRYCAEILFPLSGKRYGQDCYQHQLSSYRLRADGQLEIEEYKVDFSPVRYRLVHFDGEQMLLEEAYIDTETFLFKGIAYAKKGAWADAKSTFERGLYNADNKSADLWYWKAKAEQALGQTGEAQQSIAEARRWYQAGYFHDRPYVEEFYQLYPAELGLE